MKVGVFLFKDRHCLDRFVGIHRWWQRDYSPTSAAWETMARLCLVFCLGNKIIISLTLGDGPCSEETVDTLLTDFHRLYARKRERDIVNCQYCCRRSHELFPKFIPCCCNYIDVYIANKRERWLLGPLSLVAFIDVSQQYQLGLRLAYFSGYEGPGSWATGWGCLFLLHSNAVPVLQQVPVSNGDLPRLGW